MCQGTFFYKKQGFMVLYENRDVAQIGGIPVFFIVRPAAHVSSGCKSRIRPVVGRI